MLTQKNHIKHQGEIVENSAKVRTGHLCEPWRPALPPGTVSCTARTDHPVPLSPALSIPTSCIRATWFQPFTVYNQKKHYCIIINGRILHPSPHTSGKMPKWKSPKELRNKRGWVVKAKGTVSTTSAAPRVHSVPASVSSSATQINTANIFTSWLFKFHVKQS